MPTIHVLIKGRVQGVFYRASAKEKSEALQLSGWVKNTPQGDVEAIAAGNEEALNKFVEWCRKGPVAAHVTSVTVRTIEVQPFTGFHILKE